MDGCLKTSDLLKKIADHIRKGTYTVSAHALERQHQRVIDLKQVLYLLKNGTRDENKDLFDVKRQTWRYAICGKTLDEIKLRIIISFEEVMVIITVMRIK